MQKIVSLVQAIKELWPIKINKYSEIWADNHYEQYCIYIYIYIYIYIPYLLAYFALAPTLGRSKKNKSHSIAL